MGLKALAEKLVDYQHRLDHGKASKIKPSHVRKVLAKLQAKAVALEADIATAKTEEKKGRLRKKLTIAQDQIERAQWLLQEID